MKKFYEELKLNVVAFEQEDILTNSLGGGFDNVFSDETGKWDTPEF